MGGNNGFTDFKFILGYDVNAPAPSAGSTSRPALLLLVVYLTLPLADFDQFGLVQRAIRDSENRVLFSGYAAANYKLFVFVVRALIAGAGRRALSCRRSASSIPSEMAPDKSLEAVVWVRRRRTRHACRTDPRRDRR